MEILTRNPNIQQTPEADSLRQAAYCVITRIHNGQREYLLQRSPLFEDLFTLPGGGVKVGQETRTEAIDRELREEVKPSTDWQAQCRQIWEGLVENDPKYGTQYVSLYIVDNFHEELNERTEERLENEWFTWEQLRFGYAHNWVLGLVWEALEKANGHLEHITPAMYL